MVNVTTTKLIGYSPVFLQKKLNNQGLLEVILSPVSSHLTAQISDNSTVGPIFRNIEIFTRVDPVVVQHPRIGRIAIIDPLCIEPVLPDGGDPGIPLGNSNTIAGGIRIV